MPVENAAVFCFGVQNFASVCLDYSDHLELSTVPDWPVPKNVTFTWVPLAKRPTFRAGCQENPLCWANPKSINLMWSGLSGGGAGLNKYWEFASSKGTFMESTNLERNDNLEKGNLSSSNLGRIILVLLCSGRGNFQLKSHICKGFLFPLVMTRFSLLFSSNGSFSSLLRHLHRLPNSLLTSTTGKLPSSAVILALSSFTNSI